MMKSLSKILTYGALIGGLLFPRFANAQDVPGKLETTKIDVSAQPSNTTIYYGSGDVDGNGVVDSQDLAMFDNSLEQIFVDSVSKGKRDRADVNGDGKVDSLDINKLREYVNGNINYLPSDWNELNVEEQCDWFTRTMTGIDTTRRMRWIDGQWVSGNFATEKSKNANGVNCAIPAKYDSTSNRRFNIPLLLAYKTNPGHGANAINIGNADGGNPLLPENWIYFEPQNDGQCKISELGKYYKNCEIWIGPVTNIYNEGDSFSIQYLVKFKITDGVASLMWYDSTALDLDKVTGIEELAVQAPREFVLEQNYPNPFNSTTTIIYTLPKAMQVFLDVFDVRGERVKTLVDEIQNAGEHKIPWTPSGRDASGVYYYNLRTKDFSNARGMMFVK